MSDVAIRVENVGKRYRIGAKRAGYKTLRDSLLSTAKAPLRWLQGKRSPGPEPFWALRDVSFDVRPGEVVGIIGRNGAGKSTLLKVLSRITKPTLGRVELYGRVGSLLEVGTGFHPELTGRENIYLNGAILGMSRSEISRKFDEIVAFAEIEAFLDTPVKFYSSGMYVRLAFGVASHLEPEILIVDEVLAVGDAEFQKKSLGRMGKVARGGRTVLFVSHNLAAVTNLCDRCVWIDKGNVKHIGSADDTVRRYIQAGLEGETGQVDLPAREQDGYFSRISVVNSEGFPSNTIRVDEPFKLVFEYALARRVSELEVAFCLYDKNGSLIFYSGSAKSTAHGAAGGEPGRRSAEVLLPGNFLAPGTYAITALLHQPNVAFFDKQDGVIGFSIVDSGSSEYRYAGSNEGSILVDFPWTLSKSPPRS